MAIQPADRGPQVLGVYLFFLTLTTVAVALRVYCRVALVKLFGPDDYLAVIAWVTFVFFVAFAVTGVFHGTGQHAWEIDPPTEIPVALKWWWACEPVYVLCNMAIKASIAVMLLRLTIFPVHRIIIWVNIIITELYSAFYFFLFIFQCRPSAYFWTRFTGGSGTCIDANIIINATYGYTALCCAGDWIFAILPFFLVRKLQMNARSKLLVSLILAMGAIASTATIIRIPYVSALKNEQDFLYATTDVAIWSCCETGLGIAAASVATLRPLFRSFLAHSKLFGSSTAPADGTAGGGPSKAIYIRTPSRTTHRPHENGAGIEELGLREDEGKTGVAMMTLREDDGETTTKGSDTPGSQSTERMGDGKAFDDVVLPSAGRYQWHIRGG